MFMQQYYNMFFRFSQCSGKARVHSAPGKNMFTPPPTKIAEFEAKNGCKCAEEVPKQIMLCAKTVPNKCENLTN